jgi:hypothetical protein
MFLLTIKTKKARYPRHVVGQQASIPGILYFEIDEKKRLFQLKKLNLNKRHR